MAQAITHATPRERLATRLETEAERKQAEAAYYTAAAHAMRSFAATNLGHSMPELELAFHKLGNVDPRRAGTLRRRNLSPYLLLSRLLRMARDDDDDRDGHDDDPEYREALTDPRYRED